MNYALLGVFTLSESIAVSIITHFFSYNIVMTAFLLTAGVTIGLTVYALTTKEDVTMRGATGIRCGPI